MHRLLERHPGAVMRQLNVGAGVLSKENLAVSTVLGSCVAVTFHCPVTHTGAIFHALMPAMTEAKPNGSPPNVYKFVDSAIHHLAASLARKGIPRSNLTCKVFGGANAMFGEQFGVGRRNVENAFAALEQERLRVVASDVGGTRGRKLLFLTHSGEVYVKRLTPQKTACNS